VSFWSLTCIMNKLERTDRKTIGSFELSASDSSVSMTILGSGTSVGVPMIGCECPVCTSSNPKNHRMRTGVWVRNGDRGFLIDTSPELRLQIVRARVKKIDGVLYTHAHADHVLGMDDLRTFCFRQPEPVPLYCEEIVEHALRRMFSYAFSDDDSLHSRPRLRFERIGTDPFSVAGLNVQPIRLIHGRLSILGYRIGNVAFCTDVSTIPEESWPLLQNLDVLVLGAIRHDPHPTHFNVSQAVEVARKLNVRQTYLTHIAHNLEHEETNASLPEGIALAYDGLTIPISLPHTEVLS